MRFFKKNSYDIVRLFIDQGGIAIMAFMLYTAVGMIDDNSLTLEIRLLISMFSILFYSVILYSTAWDIGAKDRLHVNAGREEAHQNKGLLLAVFANVPNFVITLISVILVGVYLLGGASGFYTAFGFLNLVFRFFLGMYLGLIQAIFSFFEANSPLSYLWQTVGFFFAPVFALFATGFGYRMGLGGKKIFSSKKNGSS